MKRLKRVGLLILAMTLLMTTTVFAATAASKLAEVKAKLADAGVPSQFVQSFVTKIVNDGLTKSEADLLVSKIDSLKAEVGNKTSKSQFTTSELLAIYSDAQKTASLFGAKLDYQQSSNSFTVTDSYGANLGTMKPAELKNVAYGIDTVKLKEAIYLALDYLDALKAEMNGNLNQDPNVVNSTTSSTTSSTGNGVVASSVSGTTNSIQTLPNLIMATALKQTGTNNGNLLVVGFGLISLAGLVFVVSKRRVLA